MAEKALYTNKFHGWKPPCKDGSNCATDKRTGLEVLQVNSIQSLIQALGYLKYKLSSSGVRVAYRGQTELYHKPEKSEDYFFQPSALRGVRRIAALDAAKRKIKDQIAVLRTLIPRFAEKDKQNKDNYSDSVIEGLLQQYGIKTTWIDAVDNIWVALWFACYRSDFTDNGKIRKGDNKRSFIHMVRRDTDTELRTKQFAYILVLGVDEKEDEMVDLRCALPSDFIRPHVQHGLLIRAKDAKSINMVRLIKGIVRIKLTDALKWLGEGTILMPERIVPPPNYDAGFRLLLESESKSGGQCPFRFPIYC